MDLSWYLDPITKHYFDFEGVVGRRPFWMFVLYNLIITLVLEAVLSVVHLRPLAGLYTAAILAPALGLAARRLHDTGRSAWWLLAGFVPVIGWGYLIYLYCQPTQTAFGAAAA